MPGNTNKYNDMELLEAIGNSKKSVSEAAFKIVYERYSSMIYNYCFKILGDSAETEDVFQEVFLKFVDTINKKEPITIIKHFLIRMARNLCLNYMRHNKNGIDIENFYGYTVEPHSYEDSELSEILKKAIDLLEPQYKEALIFRIYEGFSYDEMVRITGESYGVLKNRVWRAKEKLMTILQPFIDDVNKENNNIM